MHTIVPNGYSTILLVLYTTCEPPYLQVRPRRAALHREPLSVLFLRLGKRREPVVLLDIAGMIKMIGWEMKRRKSPRARQSQAPIKTSYLTLLPTDNPAYQIPRTHTQGKIA